MEKKSSSKGLSASHVHKKEASDWLNELENETEEDWEEVASGGQQDKGAATFPGNAAQLRLKDKDIHRTSQAIAKPEARPCNTNSCGTKHRGRS